MKLLLVFLILVPAIQCLVESLEVFEKALKSLLDEFEPFHCDIMVIKPKQLSQAEHDTLNNVFESNAKIITDETGTQMVSLL